MGELTTSNPNRLIGAVRVRCDCQFVGRIEGTGTPDCESSKGWEMRQKQKYDSGETAIILFSITVLLWVSSERGKPALSPEMDL